MRSDYSWRWDVSCDVIGSCICEITNRSLDDAAVGRRWAAVGRQTAAGGDEKVMKAPLKDAGC